MRNSNTVRVVARVGEAHSYFLQAVKGQLKPEISLLHMKVLTLIKEKSNVFL